MAYNHRKLMSEINISVTELCPPFCEPTFNSSGFCPPLCLSVCPLTCRYTSVFSPPDCPDSSTDQQIKTHKLHPALIVALAIVATTFLLVCCFGIYVKYFRRRRTQSQQRQLQSDETHDEFLDEDHGPILDHPIWYIQTVGLNPSIISAITVCKYKRGEGLVEGTECSVCLNEFEEDETLRLLPKCSHAFHIPCIDTWLRSHTNCPMCRSGIITNTTRVPSPELNVDNSGPGDETQVGNSENNSQLGREREDGVCELRVETEEDGELQDENERRRHESLREEVDGIQPIRRSVSLDSLSASKISLALANVLPVGSDGNSENRLVKASESNMGTVSKRIGGNQSLLRFLGSSSIGRSLQNGAVPMKRSFSCSGKLLSSRYSRSRNSVLPL